MTKATLPRAARMSADEFNRWAVEQPDGTRYELAGGEMVAMAPERPAHALVKARIWRALDDAVAAAGLPCTAYPDGMAVRIDDEVVYEPDALVRCGAYLPDDAIQIVDPVILVEVLSPSTQARDAAAKLEDYFRLSSVRHYLIVKTENRSAIHHRLADDGTITTRILRGGEPEFAPPRITVSLASFFP
jgi:Uma2 family endonuclease